MATVGRSLGLGSRANAKAAATRQPQSNSTALTTFSTPSKSTTRRGFGLFDSEDEYDSDMSDAPQRKPVRFNGDLSGFASMSDSEGGHSRSVTKSSSRKSALTTPKRKSAISSRRSTPYNSTTSRALMRAKRGNNEMPENEEARLISESMFGSSPSSSGKRPLFGMSGAAYSEEEHQSTEQDTDTESKGRQANKKSKSPHQQAATPVTEPESPGVIKKTWGQWLKSILPEAVTKPVEMIIHTPTSDKPESTRQVALRTPKSDYYEGALSIPGSFEKATETVSKQDNFINPNFLSHDSHHTPTRSNDQAFSHENSPLGFGSLTPYETPQSTPSKSPTSVRKGSRSVSAPLFSQRFGSASPAPSFRKPSNFIERMRNAKKQKRYDPYSRPSSAASRKRLSFSPQVEETRKDLTPEEELELLEQRERDRQVQEAEDRYLRREALRRLGRPVEDEEMSDPDAPPKKGKGKMAAVEETHKLDEDHVGSTTPPDSPPQHSPSISRLNKATGTPLFQFQNTTPKSGSASEKAPVELNVPDKPVFSFSSSSSFEADSDKENISQPPPPPVMSHRELPAPPIATITPPALNGPGLFAEKQPVGGFGLSEAPAQIPVSPMSRQRFEKFKPRISSGLRESATIEKENENDKENPSANNNGEGPSSGPSKPGKAPFGSQTIPKQPSQLSSSGALREVGRNAPVSTGVKVDVRGKIAALPVNQLTPIGAWPVVETKYDDYDKVMQGYIKSTFMVTTNDAWMKDWVNSIFAAPRAQVQRI